MGIRGWVKERRKRGDNFCRSHYSFPDHHGCLKGATQAA